MLPLNCCKPRHATNNKLSDEFLFTIRYDEIKQLRLLWMSKYRFLIDRKRMGGFGFDFLRTCQSETMEYV